MDMDPIEMFKHFDYDKSGTLDQYQFGQALKLRNHGIHVPGGSFFFCGTVFEGPSTACFSICGIDGNICW